MLRAFPSRVLALGAALTLVTTAGHAQSNTIPGLDVSLSGLGGISMTGAAHTGVFPNGFGGASMSTTSCNVGSVNVTWEQAMDPDHPFIAFLYARERGDRFEQISNYSYVKHGFFALTDNCPNCNQGPFGGGDILGIGCADTYNTTNNGDNFWLAPAEEIDPWLGAWDPVCSHFDMGSPPVGGSGNCNGQRSLTSQMAQVLNNSPGNRVLLQDQDLVGEPGDRIWYQGHYIVIGEAEGNRNNNLGSREAFPTWNGNDWDFTVGGALQNGTVLQRWTGATIRTVANAPDDGRYFIGVKVTGPVDGLYHYEYAVHNRDANRAMGGFRVPVCDGARILNVGFKDVDLDGGNDWAFSNNGGEIEWSTNDNPLRWNSIYNFWFDSDAAPANSPVSLDQHFAGAGSDTLTSNLSTPTALYNVFIGDGCSDTTVPSLYADGAPAQATLGNASFSLESDGNAASGLCFLFVGGVDGTLPLGPGCDLHMGGLFGSSILTLSVVGADASGHASFPLPIPNNTNLEGKHINTQVLSNKPSGPLLEIFDLSDGLRVRIGDSIPGCASAK